MIKNLTITLITLLVLGGCSKETPTTELSYSEFISLVESNQVLSVEFSADSYTLKGKTANGAHFETIRPPFLEDDLSETLTINRVPISIEGVDETLSLIHISEPTRRYAIWFCGVGVKKK